MEMQVVADARSGGFAEVEAYIDALRFEELPENGRALLEQFHDFRRFLRRQKRQIHDVPQGSHHDMPVVVRKFVHDDESGFATVQDEPFLGWKAHRVGDTERTNPVSAPKYSPCATGPTEDVSYDSFLVLSENRFSFYTARALTASPSRLRRGPQRGFFGAAPAVPFPGNPFLISSSASFSCASLVSAFPSSFAARTMRITLPNCGPGSKPRRCRSSPLMSTLICRHL